MNEITVNIIEQKVEGMTEMEIVQELTTRGYHEHELLWDKFLEKGPYYKERFRYEFNDFLKTFLIHLMEKDNVNSQDITNNTTVDGMTNRTKFRIVTVSGPKEELKKFLKTKHSFHEKPPLVENDYSISYGIEEVGGEWSKINKEMVKEMVKGTQKMNPTLRFQITPISFE